MRGPSVPSPERSSSPSEPSSNPLVRFVDELDERDAATLDRLGQLDREHGDDPTPLP